MHQIENNQPTNKDIFVCTNSSKDKQSRILHAKFISTINVSYIVVRLCMGLNRFWSIIFVLIVVFWFMADLVAYILIVFCARSSLKSTNKCACQIHFGIHRSIRSIICCSSVSYIWLQSFAKCEINEDAAEKEYTKITFETNAPHRVWWRTITASLRIDR